MNIKCDCGRFMFLGSFYETPTEYVRVMVCDKCQKEFRDSVTKLSVHYYSIEKWEVKPNK